MSISILEIEVKPPFFYCSYHMAKLDFLRAAYFKS